MWLVATGEAFSEGLWSPCEALIACAPAPFSEPVTGVWSVAVGEAFWDGPLPPELAGETVPVASERVAVAPPPPLAESDDA